MKPNSRKTLTDEDRKRVRILMAEYRTQGIPREQWAQLLQNDITQTRSQKSTRSPNFQSSRKPKKGIFSQIKQIMEKKVMKMMARQTLGKNVPDSMLEAYLSRLDGGNSDEDSFLALSDALMGVPKPNLKEIGKHGTFLTADSEESRKSVEVFFDEDDEDCED